MLQTNPKTIHTMEQQIIASRKRLQELWDTHGCTNAAVLAAGIELDDLLNEYERLKSHPAKTC